ncbi:MAG: Hsp20/alpha crystallin family protein [Anaerolineae bacterium]
MLMRPDWTFRSPLREMARLQREMNRLFSDMTRGVALAPSYPAMNVWTSDEGAVVSVELPGYDAEDIDISVEDNVLTLSGSREPEELPEGADYHRRERVYGRFSRAFQLPFSVESDAVEASLKKGILHISLPRPEAERPKKITVQAS